MLDSFLSILDPIFLPLVRFNPLVGVIIISALASLIITFAQKIMTDQVLLKNARGEMKKLQEKMKKHKDNPKKMMEVQSKMLGYNKDIMSQSFKPMLITFIPIIIIFGWINLHLVYEPIQPGDEFTVIAEMKKGVVGEVTLATDLTIISENITTVTDRNAYFTVSGPAGRHNITYEHNGVRETFDVLIDNELYLTPKVPVSGESPFKELRVDLAKQKILNLGFIALSGFWSYIVFSIIFSILFRKWLKVV